MILPAANTGNNCLTGEIGYDKACVPAFREDMEKLRTLFAQWAKEIHKTDKDGIEEEWGLFL